MTATDSEEADSTKAPPTATASVVAASNSADATSTTEAASESLAAPTQSPKSTSTPKPTSTPTRTATPTRIPDLVSSSIGFVNFQAFDESIFGIRVHFVAAVTNTGNVPIEIYDLKYQMYSPSGAVVEVGDIPEAHPGKIAPGQTSAIGRTVTADTATRVGDVAKVTITYKTKKAGNADNLLKVLRAEYRGADEFGNVQVVGDVQNSGSTTYDNVKVAVILVDASGAWIGYATANIPVGSMKPGQVAQFATKADLPNDLFRNSIKDILVFAYDR